MTRSTTKQYQQIISLVTQSSTKYNLNKPHTERLMAIAERKGASILESPEILNIMAKTFSRIQKIGEPERREKGALRYEIRLPRHMSQTHSGRAGTTNRSYQITK